MTVGASTGRYDRERLKSDDKRLSFPPVRRSSWLMAVCVMTQRELADQDDGPGQPAWRAPGAGRVAARVARRSGPSPGPAGRRLWTR